MILHKYTKMETLSQIVNREFEANIFNHSKKQNNVNARKVFCKILSDIGFSSGDICGFMKKSYGVYMYYMGDVENLLNYNPDVKEKYLESKDLFFITIKGVVQDQYEYVPSRSTKMEYSVWDRNSLEKVEDKYGRIRKIIELVDINTPLGEEHLVFDKLVQVFETISDHGKKTREGKC
tara:strand:- start:492 stop:1025 length:534 start_codon:yes stop_codon:yes gene_type:complete